MWLRDTKQKWEWRWSGHTRLYSSMPQAYVPLFCDRTDRCVVLSHLQDQDFLPHQHSDPSAFLALTQCSRGQSSSLATQLLVSVWVTSFLFAFPLINNTTHLLTKGFAYSATASLSILTTVNYRQTEKAHKSTTDTMALTGPGEVLDLQSQHSRGRGQPGLYSENLSKQTIK